MPAPEIQVSKDGLKLSYQRYMADSAAGFVVILGVMFLVGRGIPLPVFGHSLETFRALSGHAPLFIFLIIFLLATPIGLLLNGIGWFLLGWCKAPFIKFLFSLPRRWYNILFSTKEAFYYTKLIEFFQIDEEQKINNRSIYEVSELHEDYLNIFFSESIRLEHVAGLRRFTRSLACLSFFSIFFCLHMTFWYSDSIYQKPIMHEVLVTLLFLTTSFTALYSLLGSFSCLRTLSTVYILCIARGISNENLGRTYSDNS